MCEDNNLTMADASVNMVLQLQGDTVNSCVNNDSQESISGECIKDDFKLGNSEVEESGKEESKTPEVQLKAKNMENKEVTNLEVRNMFQQLLLKMSAMDTKILNLSN